MSIVDMGQIAQSAIETALAVVRNTGEITTERAVKLLHALESDLQEVWQPGGGARVMNAASFDVDGKRVTLEELIATYREAVTKTVDVEALRQMLLDALALLGVITEPEDEETPVEEPEPEEELPDEEPAEEMTELCESISGAVISLVEGEALQESGARAPLLLDLAIIEPGWGNKEDNHYYFAEMLKRDARVFEGLKMYATNHRANEKSVRTEVSVIRNIIGFTEMGAPIARVAIHDPDFAEATRNRAALGTLDTLECSILAKGRIKEQEIDGRKANVVEAITSAQSVDWVTSAGAGGHALNLAESHNGGETMEETTDVAESTENEVTLAEGDAEVLAENAIKEALEATNLPMAFKEALAMGTYADDAQLKTAIETAIAEVKKLTGSGQIFGQGCTAPVTDELTEAEREEKSKDAFNRIMSEVGLEEV